MQVNERLPSTSYIKMVDIWLIFNLFIPFLFIILHTAMDTRRLREEGARQGAGRRER